MNCIERWLRKFSQPIMGPDSGAAFNPAVYLGLALDGVLAWSDWWIYIGGPILGGCVAAGVGDVVLELVLPRFVDVHGTRHDDGGGQVAIQGVDGGSYRFQRRFASPIIHTLLKDHFWHH